MYIRVCIFLALICRAHLTEGLSNNVLSVYNVRQHYTLRNVLFYYSLNRVMGVFDLTPTSQKQFQP